eukprot:Plantae.Rhodophyta-Hildenbrandia_rubra.ctg4392.p1 GENE.Plantae.Rhodophyta-Hildenbrandia_rubra.ctg4392~~Plantae.Rhodophyta-Hildenbrandia_rubra.ctg4392.p1  ORF type:complete len:295 (-),score=45.45 Plantae.Rhodophyta-Hildenbrandia_rubra.ctg4392:554-1438(-)
MVTAFLIPSPVPSSIQRRCIQFPPIYTRHYPLRSKKRPRCVELSAEVPEAAKSSTIPALPTIPSSFLASCKEVVRSSQAAIDDNVSYQFIEFDTTSGDPTYSLLKNTLPVAKAIAQADWDRYGGVQVVMPDVGTAAMVRRDWGDAGGVVVDERQVTEDCVCVLVAPGAKEVEILQRLVDKCDRMILLNPDLVDMGVTGLSLNARKLRDSVIDLFQTVFCLRTYDWGLLLRMWPGVWTIWKGDKSSESGFKCLKDMKMRPTDSDIEDVLNADGDGAESVGFLGRIRRFLSLYMKG